MGPSQISSARKNLLDWYQENKRSLPWRETGDPYRIWVSEIMLQQTRVDQATPYYHRFLENFPTVFDLANAPQDDLLMVWEGLGYYSRARNMHATARQIVSDFGGVFPGSEPEIRKLKGIGPYTSAAILSIAFQKPYAVLDGNVIRVISRLHAVSDDVRSLKTRNSLADFAQNFLDKNQPGTFNQAVMELGATVCKPRQPDCGICPLNAVCKAKKFEVTDSIPYKSPAKPRPHKQIGVGVIINKSGKLLIAKRPDDAMLGGFWEFPGGKQDEGEPIVATIRRELLEELGVEVSVGEKIMEINHAYTHFSITMHAYFCRIESGVPKPVSSQEIRWIEPTELFGFPFPKANRILTHKLSEILWRE